ncbi:hypothetical protein CFter6_0463 [Collimonas fungivorans]|uniref:Uncharacterized protein n=1 Tax=Collimonas fungivorans TaxID=158899 RepID=A0A127P689_9BURK|nr:hypothetical protein CFter6_0463 [Collimonas fungivorans]
MDATFQPVLALNGKQLSRSFFGDFSIHLDGNSKKFQLASSTL